MSSALIDVTKGGDKKGRHLDDSVLSDLFDIEVSDGEDKENRLPAATVAQKVLHSNKSEKSKPQKQIKEKAAKKTKRGPHKISSLPKYLSGHSIRRKRGALGLTQAKFATKIGVCAATISKWEAQGCRKLNPAAKVMKALEKIWN